MAIGDEFDELDEEDVVGGEEDNSANVGGEVIRSDGAVEAEVEEGTLVGAPKLL